MKDKLGKGCIALGMLLLLAVASASDADYIATQQILFGIAVSIVFLCSGFLLRRHQKTQIIKRKDWSISAEQA